MNEGSEPCWISLKQVLLVQKNTIEMQGGSSGIRDEGLLESALARPQNSYAYGEQDMFLYLNGYNLKIKSIPIQIALFEDLAKGSISREELSDFYRQNTSKIEKP